MSTLDSLLSFGFTPSEAKTYISLLEQGELNVGDIAKRAELSRAGAHEALTTLLSQALIEVRREGRNTYYKSTHPNVLFGVLEEKKRDDERHEHEMKETVQNLIGMFNLSENKPGVRFFEGRDGVKSIFDELLTATEEIYTFADAEAVEKVIEDLNKEYVAKRKQKKQSKRILVSDTEHARATLKNTEDSLTQIRLLPKEAKPFQSGMNIYNNKIVYLTLTDKNMVGVIIEDTYIYKLHRSTFEILWNISTPLS